MLYEFMSTLRRRGFRVSLLAVCQPRDVAEIQQSETEWASARVVIAQNSFHRRMRSAVSGLFEMAARAYCRSSGLDEAAGKLLMTHEFDVIHLTHPWLIDTIVPALPPNRMGKTRLVGQVIDVHTAVVERRLKRSFSLRLVKELYWSRKTEFRAYAHCDRLLCHSTQDIDYISRHIAITPPCKLIPVWFDAIDRVLPSISMKPASTRFLMVGNSADPRMRESVNWILNSVWPFIVNRLPEVTLHLWSIRPEHRRLWSGVPGVVMHGYVDDIVSVYDDSCALLFPLQSGGYSRHLKILNAMARGCPVILTQEANSAEQLVDGQEALVRDDPDGFRDAMLDLLMNPGRAHELSSGALTRLKATYGQLNQEQELVDLHTL